MHGRGDKCGPTFYSVTVHGHTLGACARLVSDEQGTRYEPLTGKITAQTATDKTTGQVTVTLSDANGEVIAVGFIPEERQ